MSKIDTHKGVIAWFARNSVAANLLMWILLIGGLMSAITIQKQVFPNFEFNAISVRVPYLGAAPQEVEEGVLLKIEEAVKDIEGIKKITSTATEGLGSVVIEVEEDYDPLLVLDEVKVQVDAISTFPESTEKPVIYRQKATQDVIWLSVYGDATEKELKEFAKEIRDDVANLPGISSVKVEGARDYEISVEISEPKLQEYNLTFSEVVAAIQRSSVDIPGGSIRSDAGKILLRAKGQAYTKRDFDQLVLFTRNDGTRLLLGDIATVKDGFVEDDGYAMFDDKPSVSIRVSAVGDQNALEISKEVNAYIDQLSPKLPAHLKVASWGDSSFYLADRLNMMLKNMASGALLVFIVLSLFLKLRLAFWVMMGLPVCFLGTLFFMPVEPFDLSINMLSLFGFILVLGIVVDDAIIIGESAYSEIDKKGHSTDNVIAGVKRVAMPATFGVLTTIVAFVPMLMVTGTFGVIWKTIGWVVIICLAFSLVESKLILPAHLVHMKDTPYDPSKANPLQRFRDFFSEGIKRFIQNKYTPALEMAMNYRYTTVAIFLAMLILTIGVVVGGKVRMAFFPDIPNDFVLGNITMENGASVAQRNAAIQEMVDAMNRMDAKIYKESGEHVVKHYIAYEISDTSGEVFVELTKGETRSIGAFDIYDRWRDQVAEIPGLKSMQISGGGGPNDGADISLQFSGKDLQQLRKATNELKAYLRAYDGVADVNDSFSGGSDEIRLHIKPEAEALGLSLESLASQVRYGFYGAEAQRIQRGDEEVKVMVRYPKEERDSVGYLENMRVRTSSGDAVPFSEVADVEMAKGYSSIIRVNGSRSITISAEADKSRIDPNEVTMDVVKNFIPDLLARYPSVTYELEGASKEQGESIGSLISGFVFALFAIYALMAIPLKSYSQPLIIMSVIPFGIVGAIVGHMMLGHAVSVLSLCGIIALTGVVVNDSLIMVDFVNAARAEGHSLKHAVLQAGAQRFRAIILTSLTTFMGLVPILAETSLQAQIVIPMATSLAFGILFATVITLFLVPALYLMLNDFRSVFGRKSETTVSQDMIGDMK